MSADHYWVPAWFNFSSFFSASTASAFIRLTAASISLTLRSEFLGVADKLDGIFAPGFQLSVGSKLERHLLVLDFLPKLSTHFLTSI